MRNREEQVSRLEQVTGSALVQGGLRKPKAKRFRQRVTREYYQVESKCILRLSRVRNVL